MEEGEQHSQTQQHNITEGERPQISPDEGAILAIKALEELHTERVQIYHHWEKYGTDSPLSRLISN